MKMKILPIAKTERIFCNRTLNMNSITSIGFDMDYTLALYRSDSFERLAYEETLKKLVQVGYPDEILKWKFDPFYMVRGLLVDKHRGNIIKIDRYRYVKIAYHGTRALSRDERRKIYDVDKVLAYEEPDFALIDTLFSLADALLFAQLVDLKDSSSYLNSKTYQDIYYDIRRTIDLCHRDGSIKKHVAKHPELYLQKDPHLKETLEWLRESGKKLFIITNSLWDYTNVIMNYVLGEESSPLSLKWLEHFDLVITGSQKPSFFMAKNPLYEVDLQSGQLKNIEHLSSYAKVYQGGHYRLIHDILQVKTGSEILYVGDHIYGDILRSKKEIGWRTMLVIEELKNEVEIIEKNINLYMENKKFQHDKEAIEELLDQHLILLEKIKRDKLSPEELSHLRLDKLEIEVEKLKNFVVEKKVLLKKELEEYHKKFHIIWGALLKTGQQKSRFAAQLENYACLYTSQVSNLRHYSTNKIFRAMPDTMPHDFVNFDD